MKRIKEELYERDDIGLLPLTDEAKERFLCLTDEGLTANFKPIIKLSKDEISYKLGYEISGILDKYPKNELNKLKAYISVVLLKKYTDYNYMYDFTHLEFLQKSLLELCNKVTDDIINIACQNIFDDCLINVDDFCDMKEYNKTYKLCKQTKDILVNELDRLDNTYSFSYSDNVKEEDEDAHIRYNFLLKDLDYFDEILSGGKKLTDDVIKDFYEEEKKISSIKEYVNLASIYKIITKRLFDGNIDDPYFIRDTYKKLSKTSYWKNTPRTFRKQFHNFLKSDLKEKGVRI